MDDRVGSVVDDIEERVKVSQVPLVDMLQISTHLANHQASLKNAATYASSRGPRMCLFQ